MYYAAAIQIDSVVLAVDDEVFAVKKAGAIAAKGMSIATNKTQHNLEASPDEVREHVDLAKAAILAALLRWATTNQALRRQPRQNAINLLASHYVFHMGT